MDKKHEYRVGAGAGIGLTIVAGVSVLIWPEVSTYITYPLFLMGATLTLWGLWPPIIDWIRQLRSTNRSTSPSHLGLPSLAPVTDFKLRELFFHINPQVLHYENWAKVGLEIRDRLSTGQLVAWGRKHETKTWDFERAPYTEIPREYWADASFQFNFFEPRHDERVHVKNGVQNLDYAAITVNKSQALKIWPQSKDAAVSDLVPLAQAAIYIYTHGRKSEWLIAKGAEGLSGESFSEGTPAQIIDFMAQFLMGKVTIYAKRTPSTELEIVSARDLLQVRPKDSAKVLNTISGKERFTEPYVRESEVEALIATEDASKHE